LSKKLIKDAQKIVLTQEMGAVFLFLLGVFFIALPPGNAL